MEKIIEYAHSPYNDPKLWSKIVFKCNTRLIKVESIINMLLKTKHIRLNKYLYHQKILKHSTPACLCGHNQQLIIYVVVFCLRHAIS